MKKKTILLCIIIVLLLLISCKERTSDNAEVPEEQQSEELFDTVLNTPTGAIVVEDSTEETDTGEETTAETQEESEEEISYADPSCGDAICTYYETYDSCPDDCVELTETTLNDYPEFLEDGTLIIVGNDAPSTDVITATVISTYLVTKDITTETKLAGEVSDYKSTDMILIGNPCDNAVIANLLHYSASTCSGIITEQNNAVIKLLVQDSNEIIIITGYDIGDTKGASAMLTDSSSKYNLNGAEEWINLDSEGDINLYFSKN